MNRREFIGSAAATLAAGCVDVNKTAKGAAIGSNYMLNVGPDPLGRFPAAAIEILDGLKKGRVS